jgi:hypothetical protein
MRQEPTAPVELATFDPPVARAVVAVLRPFHEHALR